MNHAQSLSPVETPDISNHVPQTYKAIILSVVVAFVIYCLLEGTDVLKKRKLPPGPKGVPFFGNLFQLSKDVWVTFAEWGQQYGAKNVRLIGVVSDFWCI